MEAAKTPSQKHPLHAEYARARFGMTTEEYDRIFSMRKTLPDGSVVGPYFVPVYR